jgi:hypothetical protein
LDQVLGLVLLALYIVGVVGLAAAMTWITVKIFPTKSNGGESPDERKKQPATNGGSTGGRLFRKAKRGEA